MDPSIGAVGLSAQAEVELPPPQAVSKSADEEAVANAMDRNFFRLDCMAYLERRII
jgi:hypothetical protein